MTEIKIEARKKYLFSLENLILAIVLLYMINNLDHLTKVYYDIGKRHLEEIFHIKNLDWYKSILVIIVLDLSIVVWIKLKRWPEAVIFQVLMFLINLLYYNWPGAFSDDFNRRAAELIFTVMFGYGVSSFAFLHSTRFKTKDQLKEDAEMMASLKDQLEEDAEIMARLKSELNGYENTMQRLTSEQRTTEQIVNKLQSGFERITSEKEKSERLANQLQSKLNQAELTVNELESKNIQAEKKFNELNSELIQVRDELNGIQSNKIHDESKVKNLQSELNREKSHRLKADEIINELSQYKQKWEDACRCKHCKEIKESPNSARVHSGSCSHNPSKVTEVQS